ncbi:MAG: hypothetical protein NXI00_11070 [Cytophagales bacterium]|nr:hypothetical protein [Cytophagales bacterium]
MKTKSKVIGIYGCSCHPFKSYEEAIKFANQKLRVGEIVKNRCSSKIGTVFSHESGNYVTVKYGELKSDIHLEHSQNLIKQDEYAK